MFTVEEMNLIQAMNHTCRRMAIFDIKTSIPNIEDHRFAYIKQNRCFHPHYNHSRFAQVF